MNDGGFDPCVVRLAIPAEVLFRDLGRESVLLNLESGKYFGLDEVGTFLWNRLAEGDSLSEIGAAILLEYQVEPGQLWLDLEALVGELCEQGLLRRV